METVLALVGVVVGGLLGGAGQLLSDRLKAGRERSQKIQERRLIAYEQFLTAVYVAYSVRLEAFTSKVEGAGPEAVERYVRTHMDKVLHAAHRVDIALGAVMLVGPTQIAAKAKEIERLQAKTPELTTDEGEAHFTRLVEEFADLARSHALN